jgi:ribosome-associated heat shock protein Hsp15
VRIDKWLWAARFFKTRSLAARACELGRVAIAGQPVKASREPRLGDLVRIRTDGGVEFEVEVLAFSEIRGPATMAQSLYRETEESRRVRLELAEARKSLHPVDVALTGRPSKRDRRRLNRLRGRL